MKHYTKIIILAFCITFCFSAMAQAPLFSNDLPEVNPNEMPIRRKNTHKFSYQTQQTPLFSKETPMIWQRKMQTSKNKTNKFTPQPYQTPTLNPGSSYYTISTETPQITNTPIIIQNNNSSSYNQPYKTSQKEVENITYNTPIQIHNIPIEINNTPNLTSSNTPFEELSSNGMTRVSRDDTPNDPSIPKTPIGDGIIPFLLFILLLTIKYRYYNKV